MSVALWQHTAEGGSRLWPPSEPEVLAAQEGKQGALHDLLLITHPKLARLYLGMGCTLDEAADLASEALERIASNLPRLRDPAAYPAWVWKVARSVFRAWLRDRRRSSRLRSLRLAEHQREPPELVELAEEHRQVRCAS